MNYFDSYPRQTKGHIQMTLFKGEYKNDKIYGEILDTYEEHNLIVNMASKFMAGRMAPHCTHIIADPTVDEVTGRITSTTSVLENTPYPFSNGFQYLALGNGYLNQYDEQDTAGRGQYLHTADIYVKEEQQREFTQLVHETTRKYITSWAFVDTDYNISTEETNILRLGTIFDYQTDFEHNNADNYYIVEMGLFGGNATSERNSGHLFNYKTFKSWNMLPESKLLINWFITF